MFSSAVNSFVEAGVLEDDAERAPHLVLLALRIVPVDAKGAAGWLQDGGEHLDGGGLAGAVGAEKAENLPLRNRERDVVHGAKVRKVLHQVADFDHRVHCARISFPGDMRPEVSSRNVR